MEGRHLTIVATTNLPFLQDVIEVMNSEATKSGNGVGINQRNLMVKNGKITDADRDELASLHGEALAKAASAATQEAEHSLSRRSSASSAFESEAATPARRRKGSTRSSPSISEALTPLLGFAQPMRSSSSGSAPGQGAKE